MDATAYFKMICRRFSGQQVNTWQTAIWCVIIKIKMV